MNCRLLLGLLLAGCALTSQAGAQGLDVGLAAIEETPLAMDSWDLEGGRGLPQTSVTAIAKSPRGYLWLGTQRGIARFDGARFVTLGAEDPTPSFLPNVAAMLAAPDTSLWVGTRFNGLLHIHRGEVRRFGVGTGLPSDRVSALHLDESGRLWVGFRGGGVVYREGGEFFSPPGHDRIPYGTVVGFAEHHGDVVVATAAGAATLGPAGPEAHIRFDEGGNEVYAIAASAVGRVFLGTSSGLWVMDAGEEPKPWVFDGRAISAVAVKGDTALVASGAQVYAIARDRSIRVLTPRPVGTWISVLHPDEEGSLWIGTLAEGLYRVRPTLFHALGTQEGLAAPVATAVLQDRSGSVWVGTDGGGVQRFRAGGIDTFSVATGDLPSDVVLALRQDSAGSVWVGTAAGASRLLDGEMADLVPASVQPSPLVRAILEDEEGRIWVGGSGGLERLGGGRGSWYTKEDGLPDNSVLTLERAGGGDVWIGTSGGLAKLEADSIVSLATPEGPGAAPIYDIHMGPAGVLWLATADNGLVRYHRSRFQGIDSSRGLCADELFSVVADDRGRLWLSSYRGVFWTTPQELEAVLAGRREGVPCRLYGHDAGMRSPEATGGINPSGIRALDGRLWFPTTRGVVVIDPRRLSLGLEPPRVIVEHIQVDGVSTAPGARVTIPADAMRLEIRFTGFSFIGSGRIRFRYTLEGFDSRWIAADDSRLAQYTNVPPGRYRFRVRAANADGTWNTRDASLELVVQPHFWETPWFRIGLVVLAVGLLSAAYKVRVGHLRRKQEERIRFIQDRERAERRAVQARLRALRLELHPHFIFNTLNGISGLIRLGDRDKALEVLTRFADLTRETLRGREVTTRPLEDEIEYLNQYLALERMRFDDPLTVSVDVSEEAAVVEVPPLILQPLVENALRHGVRRTVGGGCLEIRAWVEDGTLIARVTDDGPGIDLDPDEIRLGTGLSNVKQRLAEIYGEGGQLRLVGAADGGVVEVHIPATSVSSAPASAACP